VKFSASISFCSVFFLLIIKFFRRVYIKIVSGAQSGKILRLRGKGIPDVNGYKTGDQLVYINVYTPKKLNNEEKKNATKTNGC
jgi:DnaJ-class molecular chaperone